MAIRDREIPPLVTEMLKSLLPIDRNRIVHFHLDSFRLAVFDQLVPPFSKYDIKVKHQPAIVEALREADLRDPAKGIIEEPRIPYTRFGNEIDLIDEPVANHSLQRIEA